MSKLSCVHEKVRGGPAVDGASLMPEFAELFAQLNTPSDCGMVDVGYSDLMARINSPTYRRRIGSD